MFLFNIYLLIFLDLIVVFKMFIYSFMGSLFFFCCFVVDFLLLIVWLWFIFLFFFFIVLVLVFVFLGFLIVGGGGFNIIVFGLRYISFFIKIFFFFIGVVFFFLRFGV